MPTGPRRPTRKKHQAKHTVVVHVAAPDGFVELRLVKWTIRVAAPPVLPEIISSIRLAPRPPKFKKPDDLRKWQALADSASALDYGSADGEIIRRVDDLVRKLRAGWFPATGATGQVKKQHQKRAVIRQVLRDLIFALTGSPPPVMVDSSRWFMPELEKQSKRISARAQLKAAHHPAAKARRKETLGQITDALVMAYPPLLARGDDIQTALASSDPRDFIRRSVRRRNRLRRNQLRRILGKRVGDQDATRFAFKTPESLAVALCTLMFRCSQKTVRRSCADLLTKKANVISPAGTPAPLSS